ncbi:MAG: HD-GYP domain-containing protein [Candidatus Eisenbacteria bacterium]|nr:HD-GYP domain-containing protein [Candidatus Eisenbacteria bacterium]
MSALRDVRHPRRFIIFYTAVLLAAAFLLLHGFAARGHFQPLPMAVAFALLLFAEAGPVQLPSGGIATASAVIALPALILFGPFLTASLDIVCLALVQGLWLRRPFKRVVFNAAAFTVTNFAAWQTWHAASIGADRGFAFELLPIVGAGLTLFAVNSLLVSAVIALTEGPGLVRVWERNFQHSLPHHLSFVALGVLVAVTYRAVGAWALALCGPPFLVARHSFRLYMEIRADLKDFVRALSEVLEEVDPYTRHHSVRVSQYAVRLARGMGVMEREIEEIEYAALVHDLGKIGPQHQHILQKPGSLSQEEQRTLRSHPAAGAEIVAKVRALRRSSEIVRSHHERPDGQGYPFGLRAADVPLGARILNVSDAFDAMTSDRPYRRALSPDAAIQELSRGAGTQFDAEVAACLVRLYRGGQFALIPSPSSEDLLQLRLSPRRARG